MMRRAPFLAGILPILVLILALPALAHDTAPKHSCTQPELPERFTTQAQADQFMAKANTYRQCIDAFTEAQTRASLRHQEASSKALEEWNAFAARVNERSTPSPKKTN
jgi:pyridoxine 5'-phosphate synthase PdxJ